MSTGFAAPFDPSGWSLTVPHALDVPFPDTGQLRYSGETAFVLQAQRTAPATVGVPAPAMLRQAVRSAAPEQGTVIIEVQVNPFALRAVAAAIPFGLPTFYFLFDAGTSVTPFTDGAAALPGDALASVTAVRILCVGQDRIARDPALWCAQILAAIAPPDQGSWPSFATAVKTQTASGGNPPVRLLDHRGAPQGAGTAVEIISGATTATATLTAADGGDLQRAVARTHAADPQTMPLTGVFDASGSATLRPAPGSDDFQLARVDDAGPSGAPAGVGEITVTTAARHVSFTGLTSWFEPQTASGLGDGHLNYTRGNLVTPFVNGPAYLDVLFNHLNTASAAHLIGGWATFPDVALTRPDDPNAPVTLVDAASAIGARGGGTRFLSPKFIQFEVGSPLETAELTLLSVLIAAMLRWHDEDLVRSDAGGTVILLALFMINAIVVSWIIDSNGQVLEPSKDAVELLSAVDGAESVFGPYPATVDDNPAAPPPSNPVFSTLFKTDRHFGIYHQKLALVLDGGTHHSYVGGIDLDPDRLDDARHLAIAPFHDVHAEVLGPAVRELELTFKERWAVDSGTPLAYEPEPADGTPAAGDHIVQVARTYFRAADPSRALDFAKQGDDTIRRTLLEAIGQAQEFIMVEDQYFTPPGEYTEALAERVSSGEIHTLLIVLTGISDQPFGETVRSGAIAQLQQADRTGNVVHVGYLRRHYTLPDNELRASSGRLLLMADLDDAGGIVDGVVLGPKSRLPQPPFWLAIEGELMYAFDHAAAALGGSPPPPFTGAFQVLRGPDTRLIKGGPIGQAVGPRTRAHKAGAPATVVDLAGIYVHSKLTIVDDVFMSIGSANVDRRGFYHDGEIQTFTVPGQLKAGPGNPVAALRRQIWAEILDLPLATAGPLLDDPRAARALFERSPLLGNRFTPIDAFPSPLMFDATGGDGLVMLLIKLALGAVVPIVQDDLYNGVVDPTSALDPNP